MQTRIATALPYTELEVADGNFDTTRTSIDRIVIHTMVGTWQGAAARFDDPASKVSAHYGVKLDGSLIHWLEETFTAYHADDYPMNQRSIGIEHEDGGDYNGTRPDALYTASAALVRDTCTFYGIPIDRTHILKHSEVSDAPTGCPDALDIDRIVQEAQNTAIPPAGNTDVQAQLDSMRAQRDNNWNLYQAELTTQANTQKQLDLVNGQISQLTTANAQIAPLQAQLAQAEKDRSDALAAQETQNRTIAQLKNTSYTTATSSTLINELLTRLANRLTGKAR